ncbi:MAG: chemotaxis protein CheB [Gemmatimonadota bacterium]
MARQRKAAAAAASTLRPTPFPIVGMGASAGGLGAFGSFFKAMPPDSGMAFVLVAHLDPSHVSLLPELVQRHTPMPVHQVQDGTRVEPGTVYVIPPNKEMRLFNGTLQLLDLRQPRGANLPIDSFLRSLARDRGSHAVAAILSGTGTDGALGVRAVKGELGMVMVQDPESAEYDGMPRSAIATGLADYVLPAEEMPRALVEYVQHTARLGPPGSRPLVGQGSPMLQKICGLIRERTSHDFSQYKTNTLVRRLERRLHVHRLDDLDGYVRYLQESPAEIDVLFKELLIGVTSFFRDPEAYEALEVLLLERLQQQARDYTFRVWVPGCSTGEETYSIAMVLQECAERLGRYYSFQIFGTDLDAGAIDVARAGAYPSSIAADVRPERLERHFRHEEELYRVKKGIRELLVFAPQNLIRDPPFTKLDLLCCRNLLIYLEGELQERLLPLFHYCLKPNGVLFLGSSETIGTATELFQPRDRKWKIYTRRASSAGYRAGPGFPAAPRRREDEEVPTGAVRQAEETSALQLVEAILEHSHAPPCAILDDQGKVLYVHGRTGRFLELASGRASFDLVEMARPGLKSELAAATRQAAASRQEVVRRGVRVEENGGAFLVDLVVRPVAEQTPLRGLLVVVFQEPSSAAEPAPATDEPPGSPEQLERELRRTREDLQATVEQLETSNEELRSTNEELQSANEELQSTNEELETSKEELQSLNEEQNTVNAELQSRIDQLSLANDDMKNLLDSTRIAVLFLDLEYRVQRFTPRMTEIMPLTAVDVGRPISDLATRLEGVDLVAVSRQVLDSLIPQEAVVEGRDQRSYALRVLPYRTTNNVIDGVVVTLDDITERRRIQSALQERERIFRMLFESAGDAVFIHDRGRRFLEVNEEACRRLGHSRSELLQMAPVDLGASMGEAVSPGHLERLQREGQLAIRTERPGPDGTPVPVEIRSSLIEYDGRPAVLTIARDAAAGARGASRGT